jgi:hypothetical protein
MDAEQREEYVRRLIIITDTDEIQTMRKDIRDLKMMRNIFMGFLIAMAVLTVLKMVI